jgi:hypothetical protein
MPRTLGLTWLSHRAATHLPQAPANVLAQGRKHEGVGRPRANRGTLHRRFLIALNYSSRSVPFGLRDGAGGDAVLELSTDPGRDLGPIDTQVLVLGPRRGRDPPPSSGRTLRQRPPQLLVAEPHAKAERKRELRIEAARQARQSPLYFDLTISLSKSISTFRASLGRTLAGQGMPVSV